MSAFAWPLAAFAVTAVVALAGLRAWRGWLELKRCEIAARGGDPEAGDAASAGRIELADVRERLRKLEAIATGVDPD